VGEISIRANKGTGLIQELESGSISIELNLEADILYDAIIEEIGFTTRRDDILLSPREKFNGNLQGDIETTESPEGVLRRKLSTGSLRIQSREDSQVLGLIQSVSLTLRDSAMNLIRKRGQQSSCPGLENVEKVLTIRPVVFERDGILTGISMADQFRIAQGLWGGCCVKLLVLEARVMTRKEIEDLGRTNNVDSGEVDGIARCFSDAPGIVEVFFVAHDLASYGGGATLNGGMSQAKVVVTDQISGNPALLAHEVGHVFNGDHPNSTDPTFWAADSGTVLTPGHPNPELNSLSNCGRVDNPALVSGKPPVVCCLNPTLNLVVPILDPPPYFPYLPP